MESRWVEFRRGDPCLKCSHDGWCQMTEDGVWLMCRRYDDGTCLVRQDSLGVFYLYRMDGKAFGQHEPRTAAPVPRHKPDVAAIERLHEVYSRFIELIRLTSDHRQNLMDRKLTAEDIERRQYRSMPTRDKAKIVRQLQEQVGDLSDIPGFIYEDKTKTPYWSMVGKSGILIPVRTHLGEIRAFKLRADSVAEGADRYRFWSSNWKDHAGPSPGAPVHVPLQRPDVLFAGIIRITEGELKADLGTALSDTWTFGMSGTGGWRLMVETLLAVQAKEVWIALDADWRQNPQVALAAQRCIESFREAGLRVKGEVWEQDDAA